MRIASYNVLSGGFSSYNYEATTPERLNLLQHAIQQIKADFIGLIDTFRWDSIYSNSQIAELFGYKEAYCINLNDFRLKKTGHNNGITVLTNYPIKHIKVIGIETRNAIKTTLKIKQDELDLFTVYLDDISESMRVKQAQKLLKYVAKNKLTVIMGDLNTLNREEVEESTLLIKQFALRNPIFYKNMKPMIDEMKRGQVVQLLEGNNFYDAGKSRGATVPTRLFPVKTEGPVLRLDYVFHTKQIKVSNFKVLRGAIFDKASDHYPITMELS